ncbi:permease [Cohnella nanjingensis]|uniref:Permease n=2 Tax=Cohnella nanjingensis TaxID=1387779 RepID=A0A7X0RKN5_9BACL|nr:permease [Cohnella nanjingensis]
MFISVILEAMPFILIGVLISAALQVFVSERLIRGMIPRHPVLGILAAGALGILFPICECGMVPAIRGLIRKGMPLHAASTFILAGPILNPIVFWSTLTAFRARPEIAYARMGLALAVALVAGLVIYRFAGKDALRETGHGRNAISERKRGSDPAGANDRGARRKAPSKLAKLSDMMGHAVAEFFEMGKYLIFGAIVVGLLQAYVPQGQLVALGHGEGGSMLLMMGLGFILSLCSTSDAFVAQSFLTTFSAGSLVAFMVFGPMLNLKSLLMMLAVFKTRFVLVLASLAFVLVYAGAWLLGVWMRGGG